VSNVYGGFRSGEDAVREYDRKVSDGEKAKAAWKREFGVEEMIALYEGFQRPEGWDEEDWFSLNMMFSDVQVILPSLSGGTPLVNVGVERTFLVGEEGLRRVREEASLREASLNATFREQMLGRKLRLMIVDALHSFGVAKVTYQPRMVKNDRAGRARRSPFGEVLLKEDGSVDVEEEEVKVGEDFIIDRIDPDHIIVDKDCGHFLEDGEWVAQKYVETLGRVKENKLFKNVKGLKGSFLREDEREKVGERRGESVGGMAFKPVFDAEDSTSTPSSKELEDEALVVYYEVYDLTKDLFIVFARGHKKPLRGPMPIPQGINGHPFAFLRFYLRAKPSFYPIPFLFNLIGPQKEYNLTRNDIALHRKRFRRKYMAYNMKPEEISKFENPEDGTVVVAEDKDSKIVPIVDAGLDNAVYYDSRQLRVDFSLHSGTAGVGQLGSGAGVSATEVAEVSARLRMREVDKETIIKGFVEDIGRKVVETQEANLSMESAVEMIGPDGGRRWSVVRPFSLPQGKVEWRLSVKSGTLGVVDKRSQSSAFLMVVDIIGKYPHIALSPSLLEELLSRMEIYDDRIKNELTLMAWSNIQMTLGMRQAKEQGTVGEGRRSTGGTPGQGLASIMGRTGGGRRG